MKNSCMKTKSVLGLLYTQGLINRNYIKTNGITIDLHPGEQE